MNPNLPRLLLLVWCAGASCLPAVEGVGWNQDNAVFKPASAFEGKIESFLGEPALSMTPLFPKDRFPNVVVATDGSVLAVFGGVGVRRSTDGGATWARTR